MWQWGPCPRQVTVKRKSQKDASASCEFAASRLINGVPRDSANVFAADKFTFDVAEPHPIPVLHFSTADHIFACNTVEIRRRSIDLCLSEPEEINSLLKQVDFSQFMNGRTQKTGKGIASC
jgi:hypothetical protein